MDTLPEHETPQIRVLAMPADTNEAGDIFGGWLMSQVDIAGSILAVNIAQGRVVTVAVNEFTFLKPVFVGDIVSIYCRLIKIGNTSIQIGIEAYTEPRHRTKGCRKVATAILTYVAVDAERRSRPVPRH